jgi:hypothetical protein
MILLQHLAIGDATSLPPINPILNKNCVNFALSQCRYYIKTMKNCVRTYEDTALNYADIA